MKKPGPYLVLIEAKGEHDAVFEFTTLEDMASWAKDRESSPAKHKAQFLGTIFRPRDVTPDFVLGLKGFEDLFLEFEDMRERKQRAKQRRASFKNRPNRR